MALVAWLAYAGTTGSLLRRAATAAGAIGVGLLAWWLVDCLRFSLLYEGRADHLAWALTLSGLVVLARSEMGSRAMIAAGVLLTAGFWTKQTTVTAILVAVVWITVLVAAGAAPRRALGVLVATLAAVNGLLLAGLNLATGGWQYYFAFEIGREQPKFAKYMPSVEEFFRVTGIALAACVLLGAAVLLHAAVSARRDGRAARGLEAARALARSPDARVASLLGAFVVLTAPLAIYFRTKVGGDVNAYIGVAWALGLLFAVAYRRAQAARTTALVAAVCVIALFVVAARPGYTLGSLTVAALGEEGGYAKLSPQVLGYARSHLVWEQTQADLNVEPQRSVYPNFFNITDLLAAGRQPLYLVDALLDRRFNAVAPIRFPDRQTLLYWNYYTSGVKKHEANYIWKLNQVIASGYGPVQAPVLGLLERSPGPSRAPWMGECFGPFELAGATFDIRRGGGFWCREGSDRLRLRRTPARFSEVHAEGVGSVTGGLGVTLPRPRGSFAVGLEQDGRPVWVIKGRVRDGLVQLVLTSGDTVVPVGTEPGDSGEVMLAFARADRPGLRAGARPGEVRVDLPETKEARDLSLKASRRSLARFDLGDLTLTEEGG